MSTKGEMIPEKLIGSVSIRLYAGVSGMTARKIAKEIIRDVVSAVRDGWLKLPDEVVPRFQVSTLPNEMGAVESTALHIKWVADAMGEGADIFIALRKGR